MSFGYLDDLKTIEHSTLKVPYETLNKQYRNVQKSIDRDCSSLNQAMLSIEKLSKTTDSLNKNDLLNSFSNLVDKLNTLKKRSLEFKREENELFELIKRRLDHLKDYQHTSPSVVKNFKKIRIDRILIDFFLRSSFYDTAKLLAAKNNIEYMTNIDIFLNEKEIIESLRNKDTAKCLAWCNENKSKLKKINSNLEFALRQQEFIELVRNQRCVEAVYHARKHFVNLNQAQLLDVQKSMVLLAYAKNADVSTYQDLLNDNRWESLVELFRQDNFKIHQIPEQSSFIGILQIGLSALKTPTCYRKVNAVKNKNCPVCHPNLNVIARPLPYAYCANSKLICSYSGEQINEHNLPMMLPNGFVYGYNSLLKLMSENDNGKIKCPRSGEIYDINDANKVFIL